MPPLSYQYADKQHPLNVHTRRCLYLFSTFYEILLPPANVVCEALADPRGGARDARPPWGSKFFHFHAVFGKKLKNNSTFGSWRPPWGKSWICHCEGYVFTRVCHSFCSQGGGWYPSMQWANSI